MFFRTVHLEVQLYLPAELKKPLQLNEQVIVQWNDKKGYLREMWASFFLAKREARKYVNLYII